MKRGYLLFTAAVLSLGAACADYSTDNGGYGGPGTLVLRLTTPHPDDGAVLFEVTGPAIESAATANASFRVFSRRDGTSRVVGAVVGDLAGGAVVTLQVPDKGAAAAYSARVIEVADRQSVLRSSLAGYALRVTP